MAFHISSIAYDCFSVYNIWRIGNLSPKTYQDLARLTNTNTNDASYQWTSLITSLLCLYVSPRKVVKPVASWSLHISATLGSPWCCAPTIFIFVYNLWLYYLTCHDNSSLSIFIVRIIVYFEIKYSIVYNRLHLTSLNM